MQKQPTNKGETKAPASFEEAVKYVFSTTGQIPASILLREIAARLGDENFIRCVNATCDEANEIVKDLVEDMQRTPHILTVR